MLGWSERIKVLDHLAEERVGNTHEKSRAIARARIVARRAAVHESLQNRQALQDNVVARTVFHVCHHADATCVMFEFAPIEPLLSIVYVFHLR